MQLVPNDKTGQCDTVDGRDMPSSKLLFPLWRQHRRYALLSPITPSVREVQRGQPSYRNVAMIMRCLPGFMFNNFT